MTKAVLRNAFAVLLLILLVGCSADPKVDDGTNIENGIVSDEYNEARKIAWDYILEMGWDKHAEGDWQSAEVQVVEVGEHYELFDESYLGEEVLEVSFVDVASTLVGTPEILVDSETGEVVGYLPGE
ncbi:hypothetical protein ACOQFO_16770 [Ureibacillus sp. MALMAid1270]|uniref:hypothetical protein n=1 Tax=Ureibacillus sp. MALMAid1270 TaxID=3411629 RepID=UPI003BA66D74